MATKKCPVCGVAVKVENLERHLRNQHPKADLDATELLTEEEREEVKEAKASRPALTRSGKRTIAIIAVVLAAVIVLGVLVTTLHPTGAEPGQTAPNFTLSTSTGGTVTLTDYRGTVVLIEFMNTLCPNCQNEAPILSSLYTSYSSRVHFLSVDMAVGSEFPVNSVTDITTFRTTYNTPWDYAIDTSGSVASAYGVTGTPTSFVLDRNGVVQYRFVGTQAYSTFVNALSKTLG